MKPRIDTLSFAFAAALPVAFLSSATAATVTYDADAGAAGAQDGAGSGWNAADLSFWDGAANVLWPNTTADEAIFGAGSGAAGTVSVGSVTANRITFSPPGSGSYVLSGGTITLAGAAPTIVVNADAVLGSSLAGTAGLTVTGSSRLTLTGANTYNGATIINSGALAFSGAASSTGSTNGFLAGANGSRTSLAFSSSGNIQYGTAAGDTRIGGNNASGDTGAAAAVQTSGNVTFARSGTYLELGTNTGATPTAYGSYVLGGGTLTTTVNGGMRVGNGGFGVFTQTGGTANIGRWFAIGASTGAAASSRGTVTLTGGNLTVNPSFRTLLCDRQNSTGTLNLGTQAGGSATMTNASTNGITLLGANNGLLATVNLNSGTLVLGGPIQRNGTVAGSTAIVNANGGTLRPAANNLNLLSGANGLATTVFNGGLKVDTQAFDATISSNLVAATGRGIYPAGGVIEVAPGSGGAGYLGAPLVGVTSSGGGTGATAVATVADGEIVSITLTSPGQGYLAGDTVTFSFAGGGASTVASPYVHTLVPADLAENGSGGLVKLGTGRLTLTGANSIDGPVTLSGSLVTNDLAVSDAALSFQSFSSSAAEAPLQALTSFTTAGTVPVRIAGVFQPGITPLIYYPVGGSIGGSGFAALQLDTGSLPRGVVAQLVDNSLNSSVDLNVIEVNPLAWTGGTNGVWDLATVNWKLGATPSGYLNGDVLLFDDSATGTTSISLDASVSPFSMTFANGVKNYTLSGTGGITGSTGLTKTGAGTVTVLTANSYTGPTTVSEGTLRVGDGTSNGGIAGPLENEATVIFHPAGTATHSGSLAGSSAGLFLKQGGGTQVIVSPANTSTGTFRVEQGVLQFGDGSVNGATGGMAYEIEAGAELRLLQATATPLPAGFTGAGTLVLDSAQAVNGSAAWGALNAANSFTGTLRVAKGRIDLTGGSTALGGTSKIEILAGAQFLGFTSVDPYQVPIEIAGDGWGENGYPGGLRLAGNATATWAGSVTLTADSGIMAQRGANFTVTGAITGPHQATFHAGDPVGDSGNLIIHPDTPGQNTYASTRIDGRPNGAVIAGSAQAFSTGPLIVDNATLKLNGHSHSFASLSGAGGAIGNDNATPATLSVGADGSTTSYAGVLRDGTGSAPLSFVKAGTGTLTLGSPVAYTGTTTVAQGTLVLSSASLDDASTVSIQSGAVLRLDTGASDTVGTLILGGVTVGSGTYNAAHPVYGSYFAGNGSLTIGGASYDTWAASKGLTGEDAEPGSDPDHDGISNLVEFYLDGNPLASDPSILPTATLDATHLTLSFQRRDDAEADVLTQSVQYGSDLAAWATVPLGAASATDGNGVIVTIEENATGPDDISVRIPRALAVDGKFFGRLLITQ